MGYVWICDRSPNGYPSMNWLAGFLPTIKKYGNVAVSKNNGAPKWMVYMIENPIKMDDLGGFPIIFGNTHVTSWIQRSLFGGDQKTVSHPSVGPENLEMKALEVEMKPLNLDTF